MGSGGMEKDMERGLSMDLHTDAAPFVVLSVVMVNSFLFLNLRLKYKPSHCLVATLSFAFISQAHTDYRVFSQFLDIHLNIDFFIGLRYNCT